MSTKAQKLVPDAKDVTSEQPQQPVAPEGRVDDKKKQGHRRGNGSRKGRYDGFRVKKNEATEADRFNDLDNKWGPIIAEKAIAEDLMIDASSSQPARTVNIKCEHVIDVLVDSTVEYLTTKKVILPNDAASTMKSVVKLQIKTKEVLGRRGTSVMQQADGRIEGVERAKKNLYRAPHAIAFYISNIGKIKYRGQMIYPITDVRNPEIANFPGFTKTDICDAQGRRTYIKLRQGVIPPAVIDVGWLVANVASVEETQQGYDVQDSVDTLIRKYAVILQAIESKMSYLLSDIDFDSCVGTTAQLVGLTHAVGEAFTAHTVVPIMNHMIAIGAGCRFGEHSNDFYHSLEHAHMKRDCYPNTFFVSIQTKSRPPPDTRKE